MKEVFVLKGGIMVVLNSSLFVKISMRGGVRVKWPVRRNS